jgi:hypothetical protein
MVNLKKCKLKNIKFFKKFISNYILYYGHKFNNFFKKFKKKETIL